MHDDEGTRVRSQQGDTLEPGGRRYIDLASKYDARDGVCLEFEQQHLRNLVITRNPILVHVVASGRDSNGPVPRWEGAFRLDVTADGSLSVSPAEFPLPFGH
jgi:hypothetical protein